MSIWYYKVFLPFFTEAFLSLNYNSINGTLKCSDEKALLCQAVFAPVLSVCAQTQPSTFLY